MRKRTWEINQLKNAVKKSVSFGGVLRSLGLKDAGGNHAQIKKYVGELHLNTSHFKGRAWNKGLKGVYRRRIPLEKILVKDSGYHSFKLKRRLFEEGLKSPRCEECGWAKKSDGGYLPLELDHINGNRMDNRLINLRILCPNCH